MFDNFIEENPYHSCDAVFTHPVTKNRVFVGDVQAALDLDLIATNGIKTVVTAAKGMDHVKYDPQIEHIVYPLLDAKTEDIASFFDTFYSLIEANITKGSILVHCSAGISRSSTLVISYLMKLNKMSFKEAIAEVRKSRPGVVPNLGFQRQLKKYQAEIKGQFKISKISKRGQSKTIESDNRQSLLKTQLMPNFGLIRPGIKRKMLSGQIGDKTTEKEAQVLKMYNLYTQQDTKKPKYVIAKKAASFSRQHEDSKGLFIANFHEQIAKKSTTHFQRFVKTPLEQMKAIYMPKKATIQRQVPTERGGTLYNPRTTKIQF